MLDPLRIPILAECNDSRRIHDATIGASAPGIVDLGRTILILYEVPKGCGPAKKPHQGLAVGITLHLLECA
jgi:hypothetical protein